MKELLNKYKYTIILLACHLCGMLMVHYEVNLVWYGIAGSMEGILGRLMYHKKI